MNHVSQNLRSLHESVPTNCPVTFYYTPTTADYQQSQKVELTLTWFTFDTSLLRPVCTHTHTHTFSGLTSESSPGQKKLNPTNTHHSPPPPTGITQPDSLRVNVSIWKNASQADSASTYFKIWRHLLWGVQAFFSDLNMEMYSVYILVQILIKFMTIGACHVKQFAHKIYKLMNASLYLI